MRYCQTLLLFIIPCTRRYMTVLVLLNYYFTLMNDAHGRSRLTNYILIFLNVNVDNMCYLSAVTHDWSFFFI